MKTPRGRGEKFSTAGQLCKISEGNQCNLVGQSALTQTSSLRTQGPIPRDLSKEFGGRRSALCNTRHRPPKRRRLPACPFRRPRRMGPCIRRDDSGVREEHYLFTLACSAELCAASASLAEIAAVSAAVPQLGASLPLPQARGR